MVAIELSSTKAIGVAGYKRTDGELEVLAIVSEPSEKFVRKGIIYNLDKAEQCIKSIREKLQNALQTSISQVYVAINGMGIHSQKNVEIMNFDEETSISEENIDELMDRNIQTVDNNWEILEVVPQEYKIGMRKHIDPKGVLAKSLEGNYINIVAPPALQTNVRKSFELANFPIAGMFVSPLVLGKNLIGEVERRNGCVLVDLGADTTTVAIYKENILRRLCVIPLGGKNITYDIAKLEMDEDEAEELKINFGSAYNAYPQKEYEEYIKREHELNDHKIIKHRTLCEYIEARAQEIAENINYQITQSQYGSSQLRAGIFITGLGSYLENIDKAISEFTGFDKVTILKTQSVNFISKRRLNKQEEMKYSILFSLLLNDLENCNGGDMKVQTELFEEEHKEEKRRKEEKLHQLKLEEEEKKKKTAEELQKRLAAEAEAARSLKEREEAERLRKEKEEAERLRKEKEKEEKERKQLEKQQRRKEKKEKQKGIIKKWWKKTTNFASDLVSDEDDEDREK